MLTSALNYCAIKKYRMSTTTLHWYEYNESFIVEIKGDRFKIDLNRADPFHKKWIDLRYGLEDLVTILYARDFEYGMFLHLKDVAASKMGLSENDLDIIKDFCTAINGSTFFAAGPVHETLQKVKKHAGRMQNNDWAEESHYMEKLDSTISFVMEAKEYNGLLHLRNK
jgi:hypothetical protein